MTGERGNLYYGNELIASKVRPDSVRKTRNEEEVLFLEDCDIEGNGDLAHYSEKKTKVLNNVRDYRINDKGDIAYITEYSGSDDTGELKIYSNGKKYDIDNDVSAVLYF